LFSSIATRECRIPACRNVASMKGRCVMKIQGSVALVTGSNRGLGKALVSALLEAGAAKVYAAARDVSKVTSSARGRYDFLPAQGRHPLVAPHLVSRRL